MKTMIKFIIYILLLLNFQTMDKLKTRARIAAKTDTKNNLERLWEGIDNLNDEQKFSRDAYLEVKTRIGSKILECEKAIREAESLLSA